MLWPAPGIQVKCQVKYLECAVCFMTFQFISSFLFFPIRNRQSDIVSYLRAQYPKTVTFPLWYLLQFQKVKKFSINRAKNSSTSSSIEVFSKSCLTWKFQKVCFLFIISKNHRLLEKLALPTPMPRTVQITQQPFHK